MFLREFTQPVSSRKPFSGERFRSLMKDSLPIEVFFSTGYSLRRTMSAIRIMKRKELGLKSNISSSILCDKKGKKCTNLEIWLQILVWCIASVTVYYLTSSRQPCLRLKRPHHLIEVGCEASWRHELFAACEHQSGLTSQIFISVVDHALVLSMWGHARIFFLTQFSLKIIILLFSICCFLSLTQINGSNDPDYQQ